MEADASVNEIAFSKEKAVLMIEWYYLFLRRNEEMKKNEEKLAKKIDNQVSGIIL